MAKTNSGSSSGYVAQPEDRMLSEVRIKVMPPEPEAKYEPMATLSKVCGDWEPPPPPPSTAFERLLTRLEADSKPEKDRYVPFTLGDLRPGQVTVYFFKGAQFEYGGRDEVARIANAADEHIRAAVARHGLDESMARDFDGMAKSDELELQEAATLFFRASYLRYLATDADHETVDTYLKGYCLGWLMARFEVRPNEEAFRVGRRRQRVNDKMAAEMSARGRRKEIHDLFKAEKMKDPKRTDEDIITELAERTGQAWDTVHEYAYKPLSRSREKKAKKSVPAQRSKRQRST